VAVYLEDKIPFNIRYKGEISEVAERQLRFSEQVFARGWIMVVMLKIYHSTSGQSRLTSLGREEGTITKLLS
jgi:hypothetical protein